MRSCHDSGARRYAASALIFADATVRIARFLRWRQQGAPGGPRLTAALGAASAVSGAQRRAGDSCQWLRGASKLSVAAGTHDARTRAREPFLAAAPRGSLEHFFIAATSRAPRENFSLRISHQQMCRNIILYAAHLLTDQFRHVFRAAESRLGYSRDTSRATLHATARPRRPFVLRDLSFSIRNASRRSALCRHPAPCSWRRFSASSFPLALSPVPHTSAITSSSQLSQAVLASCSIPGNAEPTPLLGGSAGSGYFGAARAVAIT